jgi:hypothetical protein
MQKRIAMIVALIFLSCTHRGLQLPDTAPSAENASQVHIIRDGRFFSFGMPLRVMFDDEIVCSLKAGEYIKFTVEPGIHTLGLSHATATLPFETKQDYYFLITASPDQFGFEIERIDKDIGVYWISKSKILE